MSTHTSPTIVGVIGHQAHGKTTLAIALLQRMASRFGAVVTPAAVHEQGLVANHPHPLWYRATSPRSEVCVVDCPRLQSDWLSSVLPTLDAAVLVVAADLGIEGRTRELLLIARQAGLQSLTIFLSRADLATDEEIDRLEIAVRRMLHELDMPGDDVPVIHGDARSALLASEDQDDYFHPIDDMLAAQTSVRPHRGDESAPFLLPCGRVRARTQELPFEGGAWFNWGGYTQSLAEQRCLLIGRVVQGTVKVGEEVALLHMPDPKPVLLQVRQIHAFDEALPQAWPGEAVGLCLAAGPNFEGTQLPWVIAGDVAATPGHFGLAMRFRARLTAFEGDDGPNRPMRTESSLGFWIGTTYCKGKILFSSCGTLRSGCSDEAEVTLSRAALLTPGQPFACRHHSGALGYGTILNVLD